MKSMMLTNKVKWLIGCALMLSAVTANAQTVTPDVNHFLANNDVSDIVMIYYGGPKRAQWTTEDLRPYVVHEFLDGHKAWLFQGFQFMEFSINGKMLVHSNKSDVEYSTRNDWKALIDKAFEPGKAFDALDKTIEEAKKELGEPPFRHKVIFGLPSPIKGQTDWGSIGSRRISFNDNEGKLQAIKWFVETFLEEFKKHSYKNIDLEGFYWVEEDLHNTKSTFLATVSRYVHSLKYKIYWMPYLSANGSTSWTNAGFDYCYIQPGYCNNNKRDFSRLERVCDWAKKRGMGIVMEFDGHLFADPDYYVNKANKCIDKFEKDGIYEQAGMAYYEGGYLVRDIHRGKHLKYKPTQRQLRSIRQLMDRMAQHIVERYSRRAGNYAPPSSNGSSSSGQGNSNNDDWRNPDYWHF